MSLLGLDIGTTGCKAAAYALTGECLATAYREYTLTHPQPGHVELDAEQVVGLIKETLAEAARKTRSDPITAMSISSLGEAMTPVSADRTILGPSIVASLDTRGTEYLDQVVDRVGRDTFHQINPNTLATTFSLPKLLWVKNRQPRLYDKAELFLLWSDLVPFMLGCEPTTSHSMANRTLLFDIHKEDWSPTLLEASGITKDKLPPIVPSGTVAGIIPDSLAGELGLPSGMAVVVGGHDQSCNALGAGITAGGKAVDGIGTFECITPVFDHLPETRSMVERGLNVEHHILPGLYVSFIYNQAGSLVRWFRDTFAVKEKAVSADGIDLYETLAAEMPDGPSGLITLPYFEPAGAPEFVSDATGVIAGLKTHTTRGTILKSIMEGATFFFAASLDTLRGMEIDTSEFIATGGGARSDAWLQIKADILGIPYVRPSITECGTLGAAILAGVASNVFSSPAEGVDLYVKVEKHFEPNPTRRLQYDQLYESYKTLFHTARDVLRDLA